MAKQTQLDIDTEGAGKEEKEPKQYSLRGTPELVKALRAQTAAVMQQEGMTKQEEMLPLLSRLLEEHYSTTTAPAIASNIAAINKAFRVAQSQVNAIVEAYSMVDAAAEERVSASTAALVDELNKAKDAAAQLAGEKEGALAELLETQSELNACKSECATLAAEVKKQREMVAALVAALALTPEQQAAAVAALCGENGGE